MQNSAQNGRVEELSANQTRALGALLTSASITEAAARGGVGERTLRRWLSEDQGFREAYRERRRSMLDAVVGLLEASMLTAVETLNEAMNRGTMGTRVRAAIAVLEMGFKGVEFDMVIIREFEDVIARLEEVEATQQEQKQRGYR